MLDPFSQAQDMQKKKDLGSNIQIASPPMLSSGGSNQQVSQNPVAQDQQKLRDVMDKPSGPTQSTQDIMNMFGKLLINTQNVPMTDTGKQLIISRLKNKYGDEYKTMPEAQDALSMFDQHLDKYSDMASNDQQKMMSNADQTLSFLREWKNNGDV